MRFPHVANIALAAALAALPVGAAQSAVAPSPLQGMTVKGWTAVAGMSGPEVVELVRNLPAQTTEASGNLPWCDAAPVVSTALKAEFDEDLVARRADGTQLWGSDLMGTWTVLLERGRTHCVIASGIGYQDGVDPGAFYAKVGLG